jgi:hypothetical protein
VTVVGHAAAISAGEWIMASGQWVNDRTHGSSSKRGSSLAAAGSICVARIRNLAGRRFSATSRYHDRLSRIAGLSQIFKCAKSLIERLLAAKRSPLK